MKIQKEDIFYHIYTKIENSAYFVEANAIEYELREELREYMISNDMLYRTAGLMYEELRNNRT